MHACSVGATAHLGDSVANRALHALCPTRVRQKDPAAVANDLTRVWDNGRRATDGTASLAPHAGCTARVHEQRLAAIANQVGVIRRGACEVGTPSALQQGQCGNIGVP